MSSFRNFRNRVHTLKWWLFSVATGSRLMLEKNNYLWKGKWEGTCLLNQTWGKATDTWWKVGIWKFVDRVGRELYILIILMFSLIFRSSLTSSNVGDSSLRFVSVFLLSTPTCWNSFLGSFVVSFEFLFSFLRYNKFFISPSFIYFVLYSIRYFITSSWLFSFRRLTSVSVCIGVFRT